MYCLRACIVNFRTAEKDIREIIKTIVNAGRAIHAKTANGQAEKK